MSDISDLLDNAHQHTNEPPLQFWYPTRCWKCQRHDGNERYHGLCNGCALWLDEEHSAPEPTPDTTFDLTFGEDGRIHVDTTDMTLTWETIPGYGYGLAD